MSYIEEIDQDTVSQTGSGHSRLQEGLTNRTRMRGATKYRIRENDIESVKVCTYVRVLCKPDDIASTTALYNSERLVGQLLPVLVPDVTARQ